MLLRLGCCLLFCHSRCSSTVASIAIRTMFAAITADTVAAGTAGNRFAHRKTVIHLLPPRLVSFRSRSFRVLVFSWDLVQQISPWIAIQLFYARLMYCINQPNELSGCGKERERDEREQERTRGMNHRE